MDLLRANDVEEAASVIGWKGLSPGIRALWAVRGDGEEEAPQRRIIHARLVQPGAPVRILRLGLRSAPGYQKCGSRPEIDWITAFRLLAWRDNQWVPLLDEREVTRPRNGEPVWFDLPPITTSAAVVELRRCGIDGWWTSWNLARGGALLEGEMADVPPPRRESRLAVGEIDLASASGNITSSRLPGEVRFRTPSFQVGFWLGRPGFSFLGLDEFAKGRTGRNLLRTHPTVALQGPRLHPVGGPPCVAPLVHNDCSGSVNVHGTTITYEYHVGRAGQHYVLEWEVRDSGIAFRFVRRGEESIRAWESSFWTIACSSEIAPTTALGEMARRGETGILRPPVLFHAPGHGTLRFSLNGDGAVCRSDSCRPLGFTSLEIKSGEEAEPNGDYLLPAGVHRLEGEIVPFHPEVRVSADAPPAVADALRRCAITALTYRADTATLTNNGNSIHAPLCMDHWSSVTSRIESIAPALHASVLMRDTLERWLEGGPGYASGGMAGEGEIHLAEDEFIMTGTAGLLGLAEFLQRNGTPEWLELYRRQILCQLELMLRRDVDQDGLVESIYRDGISGGHRWSTNWYDAISFGWKDAFSNALLYRALVLLAHELARLGKPEMGEGLAAWAEKLRLNFWRAFFNPHTGWLAGWRCRRDLLHDYAFLSVNGAAVCSGVIDGDRARAVVENLWNESRRIGLPDPRLGLPGNLWPVADADMIPLMHGKPMGYYLNGGLTHSQSRHFVGALYRTGMTGEADALLSALCGSLADGTAFGGCNTGVDWRFWDGAPCGYEGVLTDQFGILTVAVDRYCRPGGVQWP